MSLMAVIWAETAPVADVYERAVITLLAHRAGVDGTGAWPSTSTIARFAVCDEQVIRKRLAALLERGVIAYGDQSLVSKIDHRYRPKVYDLLIPHEWFSTSQLVEVDRDRAQRGLGPYSAEERPPILQPERSRKRRSDTGAPKPSPVPAGHRRAAPETLVDLLDGPTSGVSTRLDACSGSSQGYLVDDDRGIYEIPNTVQEENLSGRSKSSVDTTKINSGEESPVEPPRTRGSRIPLPFTVTPEMVAWAREQVPHVDGRRETEKFIDYFTAKAGREGVKLDWTATWRNWMRNAADRLPYLNGNSSRPPATDVATSQLDAAFAARQARGQLELSGGLQ